MSASVAIATAALAASSSNSAAISAAKSREKTKQCKEWMSTFDAGSSSVEQKQYYAQCVQAVYPKEMSFGYEIALKASVIALIAAVVIGLVRGYRKKSSYETRLESTLISGFFGFAIGAAAIGGVWMLFFAISFLFS